MHLEIARAHLTVPCISLSAFGGEGRGEVVPFVPFVLCVPFLLCAFPLTPLPPVKSPLRNLKRVSAVIVTSQIRELRLCATIGTFPPQSRCACSMASCTFSFSTAFTSKW